MTLRAIGSASATIANLGPGFDVLGLCLEGPRDRVTVELNDSGNIEIVAIDGDDGRLPRDAAQNCVGVAARWVIERFAEPGTGARIWLDKGLPLGSGLGSSAASSVAAAVATAALIDPNIPRGVLLEACREGERLAAGSPHADNVAPALFGGLVAVLPGEGEAVDVLPLRISRDLVVAVVKPAYDVRTADARAALPKTVPVSDAVHNLAMMAGLVTGFATGDHGLVARCLGDRLSTPYRKALVPGFDAVVAAALEAGAIGAGLSGSGPTVFALSDDREAARDVAEAMVDAFLGAGFASQAFVSGIGLDGATADLA